MKIKQFLMVCGASLMLLFSGLAIADNSFSPDQVKNIQQIVHDYLVQNPQVLIEASQALREQEQAKQQQVAMKAIKANGQKIFNDAQSPMAGNKDGTVTLVEFFDYQCGHCKAMEPIIENLVKKDANLRVVFKEFPIFGANSEFAAKAALAAMKQGKYWQFHEALMNAQNPINQAKVLQVAGQVGLNVAQLQKDINSPEIAQQIKDNYQLAQKLQLIGTPAFIIANRTGSNIQFVPGATDQESLQKLIDQVSQ